jgi:RNA polymerase sigma-70 factor (ECF subfamily)
MTDQEAIEAIKEGRTEAFGWLYNNHRKRVYSTCSHMLHDRTGAEDLTQEAFMHAFRKISSFRSESMFSTWLHRIVVNTVLMHLRRLKTARLNRSSECSLNAALPEDDERTYETRIGRQDGDLVSCVDRIALVRAIAQLAPGYRMIFVLHDIEGYEHGEIAERLDCSIGTSKSQLHKARMRLRQLLPAWCASSLRRDGRMGSFGTAAMVTQTGTHRSLPMSCDRNQERSF